MNKRNSDGIVAERVYETISKYNLLPDKGKVLVAVSGGADSVCLLHILCAMRGEHGFKVFAAHLNHGIRGAEADADEEYVRALCDKLKVRLFVEHADIPAIAKNNGMSEEEAGRHERYKFFRRICDENNISLTATAHNKNDQAETVIMRIVRGSGISGLRGIKYKREDGVIRPLLDVTRDEIEKYCLNNNLKYKTDSTNLDDSYTRNKIRHSVIPALCEINPSAVDALSKLARSLSDDADFLDEYARRLYMRLGAPILRDKFKSLDIESLNLISSDSIVSRLIILCARDVMGSNYSLEKKHVDMIIDFMRSDSTGGLDLPNGLLVCKSYGWLEFGMKESYSGDENNNLVEKGLNLYNNTDLYIEVEYDKLYNIRCGGEIYRIKLNTMPKSEYKHDKTLAALDYDKISADNSEPKLVLRSRRSGDRMTVYKDGGSRKIKSIFIDLKIRREVRSAIPLLCSGSSVLAIPGIRVSETYKPTKETKNVLVIYCEKEKYED